MRQYRRQALGLALILVALGVLLIPPGGAGAQSAADTLVLATAGDVRNCNLALQYDNCWFPSTLVFSRLVTMDYGPEFKVHPDLATRWEVSPDGRTYTFHLAHNVKWQDGQPFSSADVKYTYEGIKQFSGEAVVQANEIARIDTPDADTVTFTTTKVDGSFLSELAVYPRTPILPKHLYDGTDWHTNPTNLRPVGTGPFRFEEHVPGQFLSVVRNDDYFKGRAMPARVIFRVIPDNNVAIAALESGEVQAFDTPPEGRGPLTIIHLLNAQPHVHVAAYPSPLVYYLAFNVTKAPFSDPRVRRAIALAIDRTDLNNRITQGICTPAVGTYTQAVGWAFDRTVRLPAYDPHQAEQLLDEAGAQRQGGPTGTRFQMNVWVSRGTEEDSAQVIRDYLQRVGIQVNVTRYDDAVLRQQLPQLKHDAFIYGNWWGPDPAEWETYTATNAYWAKPMGYSNAQVDALFAEGRSTQDLMQRRKAYVAIQRIMLDQMPRVPLLDSCPYSFAYRTEWTGWFTDAPYSYRLDLTRVHPAKP